MRASTIPAATPGVDAPGSGDNASRDDAIRDDVQVTGDGADTALRLLGLSALALMLSTETLPFVLAFAREEPAALPGLLALLASQLLAGVAMLLRRCHLVTPWLLLVLLVGGMTQFMAHRGSFEAIDLLIPGYWLYPLVVVALRSRSTRHSVLFGAVGCLVLVAWGVLQAGTEEAVGIADQLWVAQPVAEVLLFGHAIIALASARQRSLARNARARREREAELALAHARREAARMLHDHVLHALHALSHAEAAPTSMVVEECRQAHRAMTRRPELPATSRVEELVLADLVRTPATPDEVEVHVEGTSEPVPTAVAHAMAAAAQQAVSNARRHAAASRITVQVEGGRGEVTVRVRDDGTGFDPTRRVVDRLGVGASVVQRMDDVGGGAHITSAPGAGTTVELHWPQQAEHPESLWLSAPDRLVRRGLLRTTWPTIAVAVVMSFLAAPELTHPLLGRAVSLATAVLAALAAVRLSRRSPSPVQSALLLALAIAVWAVNLWMVPVAPELDYPLWMAWAATALVHLVVLSARLWIATAAAVAWTVAEVVGLMHYGGWSAVWEHSFLVTTGAGDVAITLLVLVVALRTAAQEARAARMASLLSASTAHLRRRSTVEAHWSEQVLSEALPLLARVADGRLDGRSEHVRRTAAQLEHELRDELVLGPSQAPLLAAMAGARRAGWALSSNLSPSSGDAGLTTAGVLLGQLGEPAEAGQRVTLSATPTWAMAVLLDPSPDQLARWRESLPALGIGLDVDDDFVRLTLPVTATPAAATTVAQQTSRPVAAPTLAG